MYVCVCDMCVCVCVCWVHFSMNDDVCCSREN
jgi:hypothetical protein